MACTFLIETPTILHIAYNLDTRRAIQVDPVVTMSKSVSEASDDFEYIETPAAPTPTPPVQDYGVKTTTVSSN